MSKIKELTKSDYFSKMTIEIGIKNGVIVYSIADMEFCNLELLASTIKGLEKLWLEDYYGAS